MLSGLVRLGVLLALWMAILGGGALTYFALSLPDTGQLTRSERRPSVAILAADGSLLTTFGDLFGQPLTLKEMPRCLPQAVIATEDRRFYSHFGVDPFGPRPRRLRQFLGRACRPGRQYDHPAASQEFVPDPRAQLRPQDPRDPAGAVARAPLYQGPDSRNLSEPRLSRRRRLWRRRRRAPLFRQVGDWIEPLRMRRHRRALEGPDPVQSDPRPRPDGGAGGPGPRQHGRGRLYQARTMRGPPAKEKPRSAPSRSRGPAPVISPIGSPSGSPISPAAAAAT